MEFLLILLLSLLFSVKYLDISFLLFCGPLPFSLVTLEGGMPWGQLDRFLAAASPFPTHTHGVVRFDLDQP